MQIEGVGCVDKLCVVRGLLHLAAVGQRTVGHGVCAVDLYGKALVEIVHSCRQYVIRIRNIAAYDLNLAAADVNGLFEINIRSKTSFILIHNKNNTYLPQFQ